MGRITCHWAGSMDCLVLSFFFLDKYRIQSKTEMLTLVVACGMEGEGPAAHAPP